MPAFLTGCFSCGSAAAARDVEEKKAAAVAGHPVPQARPLGSSLDGQTPKAIPKKSLDHWTAFRLSEDVAGRRASSSHSMRASVEMQAHREGSGRLSFRLSGPKPAGAPAAQQQQAQQHTQQQPTTSDLVSKLSPQLVQPLLDGDLLSGLLCSSTDRTSGPSTLSPLSPGGGPAAPWQQHNPAHGGVPFGRCASADRFSTGAIAAAAAASGRPGSGGASPISAGPRAHAHPHASAPIPISALAGLPGLGVAAVGGPSPGSGPSSIAAAAGAGTGALPGVLAPVGSPHGHGHVAHGGMGHGLVRRASMPDLGLDTIHESSTTLRGGGTGGYGGQGVTGSWVMGSGEERDSAGGCGDSNGQGGEGPQQLRQGSGAGSRRSTALEVAASLLARGLAAASGSHGGHTPSSQQHQQAPLSPTTRASMTHSSAPIAIRRRNSGGGMAALESLMVAANRSLNGLVGSAGGGAGTSVGSHGAAMSPPGAGEGAWGGAGRGSAGALGMLRKSLSVHLGESPRSTGTSATTTTAAAAAASTAAAAAAAPPVSLATNSYGAHRAPSSSGMAAVFQNLSMSPSLGLGLGLGSSAGRAAGGPGSGLQRHASLPAGYVPPPSAWASPPTSTSQLQQLGTGAGVGAAGSATARRRSSAAPPSYGQHSYGYGPGAYHGHRKAGAAGQRGMTRMSLDDGLRHLVRAQSAGGYGSGAGGGAAFLQGVAGSPAPPRRPELARHILQQLAQQGWKVDVPPAPGAAGAAAAGAGAAAAAGAGGGGKAEVAAAAAATGPGQAPQGKGFGQAADSGPVLVVDMMGDDDVSRGRGSGAGNGSEAFCTRSSISLELQ